MSLNNSHAFSAIRVLVIGDLMLDRYLQGNVDRISPEAPVPVVRVDQEYERIGGAGNVALNVRSLAAQCHLLAICGEDDAASTLEEKLAESDVGNTLIKNPEATTTVKMRVLAQHQQLLRADFERQPPETTAQTIRLAAKSLLPECDILILSDYGKGTLVEVEQLITMARQSNVPVLVDPKGRDFRRYSEATLLTPNLKEFELVAGSCMDNDDIVSKARGLIENHDISHMLITLGERGMLLVSEDGSVLHQPTKAQEIFDVSGAGDTVIATLAVAMAAGLVFSDALQWANAAASVVVRKLGAAVASFEEIQQAMGTIQ